MENRDFYYFGSDYSQANITATTADFDSNINLYEELFYGDYSSITFPLTYKIMLGSRLHDIVSTSYSCIRLINNKVKTIFEENQFTGYKTFPVIFLDKNNREIHGYHGLSVTGRSGFRNFSSSEIIDKVLTTNEVIRKYKGFYVDEWDGTDFFCARKSFATYVTPRVVEVLKKNKIGNFKPEHALDGIVDERGFERTNRWRKEYYESIAAKSITT
jgi:hypothetical protein